MKQMLLTVSIGLCLLLNQGCTPSLSFPPLAPAFRILSQQNLITQTAIHQFREADRNHNGTIEPQEVPHAPAAFAALDRNHNSLLELEETLPTAERTQQMESRIQNLYQNLFRQVDTDGNGRVSWRDILKNQSVFSDQRDLFMQQIVTQNETVDDLTQVAYPVFERFLNAVFWSVIQSFPTQIHSKKMPVLLVPGYGEPSWYFMYGIYHTLKKAGWPVYGINLFPNFGSAEEAAQLVKAKAGTIMKETGSSQIQLVSHSFGGLISRYYAQELDGTRVIKNMVTIATPHYGTVSSYLGIGESANEMKPGSPFLQALNKNGGIYPPIQYTAIWSNMDELVIPQKNAILEGATVYPIPWTGHLTILFSRNTYQHLKDILD